MTKITPKPARVIDTNFAFKGAKIPKARHTAKPVPSKLVGMVLEMLEVSYQFQVEMQPAEAYELMGYIKPYNRIKNLPEMIKKIDALMPTTDYESHNCNMAHTNHTYRIGNEGSLVIYIHLSGFYFDRIRFDDGSHVAGLIDRIRKVAEDAGADEFHTESLDPMKGLRLRIWWD